MITEHERDQRYRHPRSRVPWTTSRIATDGTVLLKNARSLLPLSTRAVRSIAVIGDAASEHPQTAAGGSATVLPSRPIVTPLAGITARAGSTIRITHARGTLGVAVPLPAVPASAFGSGLRVTYYASADPSGTPIATGTVANLDYTGTLTAPATGDYRFTLSGGGIVRVWIDGRPVVSYAVPRALPERVDPPDRGAALDPGRDHAVPGHAGHRRRVRDHPGPAPGLAAAGEPDDRARRGDRARRRRGRRRGVRPGQ
jgi:hypothetical protein